ncbi:hypothetical protein Q428_00280 [Fervidicella metallireducens AeB]|uniref:SbsA Ig-like domain-containing protein n=1 Tax=Fervidicella metallireducens AeB TaxID=1403537 RepID=A0A017RZ49_9CLOT|nr:hypothetical protein [Fervidicella metallireducens]EYE89866.1 hypothetical protein Q428_00280 [Fervidicella metallireducens AeB]
MKLDRYKGNILVSMLISILSILCVFRGYTVSANEVLPKINRVFVEHTPLIEGETQSYFLISNYNGKVQYALKIDKVSIVNKKTVLKPYYTQNYGEVTDGTTVYKLDGTNKFEPGNYRVYIYVKRAGVEGKLKNKDFSFDSIYTVNINCYGKNEKGLIYSDGKMLIDREDFRIGETVEIGGVENLPGPSSTYKYSLNIFDINKNKWLMDVSKYNGKLKYIFDKQGQYILDVAVSSDSTKIVAHKNRLINICDNFKVKSINYIDPTTIQVNFTMAPDVTDVQNKNNYFVSTSEINTISMVGDKSALLQLKNPIAKDTLYFVNSIKLKDNPLIVTYPFTEIEKRTDNESPFVKNMGNNKNSINVTFSEPLKNIGSAYVVQGETTIDVSEKFAKGTSELKFELKDFSPDESISLIIKNAQDMFGNTIEPNPYIANLNMIKTDFTKPAVSNIKVISPEKVEVTFSEKLKYPPIVMVGSSPVYFDEYSSSDNITFLGTCYYTLGKNTVKVISYQDLSGNFGEKVERELDFKAEKTSPRLTGVEKKVFNNKMYLVLNFDRYIKQFNSSLIIQGTRELKTQIQTLSFPFAATVNAASYLKENGADKNNLKSVIIDISNIAVFPTGTYKVKINPGLIMDFSNNYSSEITNVTFTCDGYYNDGKELFIVGSPQVSWDFSYIDIEFSKDISDKTALDVSNYRINGQCIFQRVEKRSNKNIRLILASDHINYSGYRTLEINGVTDDAGNKIDKYQSIIYLGENKKPYIDYAVLKGKNTISVIFSENVYPVGPGDFEVYIDGTRVSDNKISILKYTYFTKEVEIKVDPSIILDNATKTIQIKLKGSGIMDISGNKAVKDVYIKVLK